MRRMHIVAGASVGALALLASSLGASAAPTAPADDTGSAAEDRTAQAEGAGEYVVAYQGDAAAATEAVAGAGGQVVDVNEQLGIALVESSNSDFIADAQATAAVTGAARNHSVGLANPGLPHRFADERPSRADKAAAARPGAQSSQSRRGHGAEPLANLQWDMAMMNTAAAHRDATGNRVTVGIIDTGVDGSHPDIAPNFDAGLSRNFTMDIPLVDGACEVPTCIDPADVDENGHGTHVAGIVGAARNGIGTAGVAPDATIVNVRAGQDSGFFFVYETVAALVYAGDVGLDVVNMSFFTDPWLYNCDSADDYISGPVTPEQLAEQAFIRQTVLAATAYAHDHGVTLVGAAGNSHTDMAAPQRHDTISPDFPGGTEVDRVVTNDCLDLPSEAPETISVVSVGPSTTKSDFSNYGLGSVEVAAPGGWFRDFVGTPQFQTPGNLVLSSYPLEVAIAEGLVDANGIPVDDFSNRSCDRRGENCGIYTRLQGTSMASPHVAGLAALVIEEHGRRGRGGYSLDPDTVRSIIEATATDKACPAGGVEIYTDEGRPAEFNAVCQGTTAENGLYGEGIVNAEAAVD
jgi:lantibiotic leader peptide-processing serine protease